ncbi:YciI-like protein [Pseudoxanthomonas sp. UTMC 1351]|uniref:YciI-like protein n=1 Tax=Pseudoxanthomonas sp. UTMC 1351 TaxID=2695853 RepID=UPI0034CF2611
MHYVMIYDCSPDYPTRRAEFRAEHLKLAWEAHARGELILAGAMDDPLDGALLLFQCDSPAIPEAFAKADPYVKNGLVTQWRIRTWHTVVGTDATQPIRPGA